MVVEFGDFRLGVRRDFRRADGVRNQALLQVDPAYCVVEFIEVRHLLLSGARVGKGEIEIAAGFREHVGGLFSTRALFGSRAMALLIVAEGLGKLPCAS